MTQRIDLSPEVRGLLRPEDEARIHEVRGHTELCCFVCEGWIVPESDETATVSVVFDPNAAAAVVKFAHAGCAPSRADVTDLPAERLSDSGGITYIWERNLDVRLVGPEDEEIQPYLENYRAAGFAPVREGEPVGGLPDWRLALEGEDLVLYRGDEVTDRFEASTTDPPGGWFEALRETNTCFLVVGSGLGLDRADPERIAVALASGQAIVALVQLKS
jgi:hypothetical protein